LNLLQFMSDWHKQNRKQLNCIISTLFYKINLFHPKHNTMNYKLHTFLLLLIKQVSKLDERDYCVIVLSLQRI
jgi:hypothetical protein